jgi:plasmid maintenance system antidote protein VapI
MKEANRPFADGLSRIISEKGLKQVWVAEKAGLTPKELSDMLNGRKLIKACDIVRLAAATETGIEEIFTAAERR